MVAYFSQEGYLLIAIVEDLGVTQKTAWFMLHRIRICLGIENHTQLSTTVEVDEAYIGGKEKFKHENKRTVDNRGRSTKTKTAVLGLVERKGKLVATIVPNASVAVLTPTIQQYVAEGATVYTDEWKGYRDMHKIYEHLYVHHKEKEFVCGDVYTNTIEGFWSYMRRGLYGIYHYTSKKHLQSYINEYVYRYNTRKMCDSLRFNSLLCGVNNNRLRYTELINERKIA